MVEQKDNLRFGYTPLEETLNIATHVLGFVLAVVATLFLLRHAFLQGALLHQISFTVFGLSLCLLYFASSFYHSRTKTLERARMRILDHAAIYILIAGTYTPFTLVTLKGRIGWTLFFITWTMAIVGVVLKIFFTGRFKVLSTAMYVLMGWLIVFAIKPLAAQLPEGGLSWLVYGGVSYTLGAVLYSIKPLPYNHALFHAFVLLGSACHYLTVYAYVLP